MRILRIYEYLRQHRRVRWGSLASITLILVLLAIRLTYKEDISDFLPLGTHDREMLDIYQDISGADRLVVVFDNPDDADKTTAAIGKFCQLVETADTAHVVSMTAQVDMEAVESMLDFVYGNIPYFLTEQDYARMDSMLAVPDVAEQQLEADKEMLMFPSGSMLAGNIGRDPLNIFTPVVSRLLGMRKDSNFEVYDGYLFTSDMKRGIVMLKSPYGNAETEKNEQLIMMLEHAIDDMHKDYPEVKAHVTGGPQIAVGNARQIKSDSILAVGLAVVLIVVLLIYSLRSLRSIVLIIMAIGWGWLFALGGMSLLRSEVSIIVIGMSSVILGIAVNYPLHLVAHMKHVTDVRQALKDISTPLLVGNITTVGAFLALVPLQSTALRDLGIFASLMLVGTIAFVLLYMPQMVKGRKPVAVNEEETQQLAEAETKKPYGTKMLIATLVMVTLVLGWFSLKTEFNTDTAAINYMTDQQRDDMEYFGRMMQADTTSRGETAYVVAMGKDMDAALDTALAMGLDNTTHFLTSRKEQAQRLRRWQEFKERHAVLFHDKLQTAAVRSGFAANAFDGFNEVLKAEFVPRTLDYFAPLTQTVFAGNISIDKGKGRYAIVETCRKDDLGNNASRSFTAKGINAAMLSTLSDNFNYIGIVCSAIVFIFLWLSFRRLSLAVIAFIPMAVSWVWILGIMAMLGIKFNIVNIILATFIFGQGDDYTIFMTEGCLYERRTGRKILASYKYSIILSALIMFIGIGTLITARHPALFSLAEVTIIGMVCVVLMAWLLPPLLFRLCVRGNA